MVIFRGGWSTEGVTTAQHTDSFIQCSSMHLTSFAVLIGGETGSDNEVCAFVIL